MQTKFFRLLASVFFLRLLPVVGLLAGPIIAMAQTDITQLSDPLIASSANSPGGEPVGAAIDNNTGTKYLNFDRANTGFVVSPSVGATIVTGMTITSANDAPERDPAQVRLEGSNDATIAGFGSGTWAVIYENLAVPPFAARAETQTFSFANTTSYTHYRWTVIEVANAATANSMQVAEVELLGTIVPVGTTRFTFDHVGTGATGTITENGPADYTMIGGGNDIWSAADEFDFAHSALSGDFDVRVRVESLEPTARWTKAGVMARETLAGNSRMAFSRTTPAMVPTPSGGDGAGDVCYAYRTGTTAASQGEHEDGCATAPSFFPNNWVRLVRAGNNLIGYRSTDGAAWTEMGNQDTTTWEGGAMPAVLEVGLAVSRHSGPETLATAEYRNYANVREDPVTIVSQPANATVLENQTATFSVGVAGGYDHVGIQWQLNNVNIPGATGRSYTTAPQPLANSGDTYRAIVTSAVAGNGTMATSTAATLMVSSDPVLISASSLASPNSIFLQFSEPMDALSALEVSNYDVPGVNIDSAAFFPGDESRVVLTVSPNLPLNVNYDVTVFNVEDQQGNVISPNPSFGSFAHPGAGSFGSDFNDGLLPARSAVYGGAAVTADGGVGNSGVMRITEAANSLQAFWLIEDINGGRPIDQFDMNMKVRIGGSTCCGDAANPRPADGWAISFASDLPDGIPGPALACCGAEDGGGSGLVVSFDSWDNAAPDTAPSVDVIYRNAIVGTRSFAGVREGGRAPATDIPTDPATGNPIHFITDHPSATGFPTDPTFVNVRIKLDSDGTIDVWYKDVLMIDNLQTGYVPQTGRFGFGARTGGANETHFIDDLSINAFGTLGPVTITGDPVDAMADENASVSFRVSADGSPVLSYQWQVSTDGGATFSDLAGEEASVLSLVATAANAGNHYRAVVRNGFSEETSGSASLSVNLDLVDPELLAANASGFTIVTLQYSEPMDPATALDPFNYEISDGVNAGFQPSDVAYGANQSVVVMTTPSLNEETTYTVTLVNPIADQSSSANEAPAGTSVSFITAALVRGFVPRDWYGANVIMPMDGVGGAPSAGIGGVNVTDLTNHPSFPDNPVWTCWNNIFQLNTVDQAENFGARINGIFIPRTSGDHIFYISADDGAALFLSSNESDVNKVQIAREPVWNGRRQWLVTDRRDAANPENRSAPINLVAGNRYYIEALVKEGGGGDNLAVAVQEPGQQPPANDSTPIIGALLGSFRTVPGNSITISSQPADVSGFESERATFTVGFSVVNTACQNGNLQSLQWFKNGTAIEGATSASYTTPVLTLADNGATYHAVVQIPGVKATSATANLVVAEDVTPPAALSASSVETASPYIGVCFSERLSASTAENPANYVVSGGANAVMGAQLTPSGEGVRLQMASPVVGNFSVSIQNVTDVKGLVMSPTTLSGRSWAQGVDVIGAAGSGPTSPPGNNFSCNTGDVDVTAGGSDIWGTSDEFHFVYGPRAGDFDVQVKVQRLDAANNWSKAGLMARETLDGNSRTIESYTTPLDAPGTASYENGRRVDTGSDTIEWGTRPATGIPNAWIRLKRVGNTFTALRGTDGVNWTVMGGPVNHVMTPQVLVGMATTSHNTGGSTVAEFRNYRDTVFPDAQIQIAQRPVSQTVDNNGSAQFSVAANVTGAPASELTYQWQVSTDGGATFAAVVGANSASYSIPQVSFADDNKWFRVIVSVPGVAVISPAPNAAPAILRVITDINPPKLVTAKGDESFQRILLQYNEPVEEFSSTDAFAYEVLDTQGNPVDGINGNPGSVVPGPDVRSVWLNLAVVLQADTVYTVRVNGVLDLDFNEIVPNSTIDVRTWVISCGFLKRELWTDIGGVLISDFTNLTTYPDSPNQVGFVTLYETPVDVLDNYGVRLSGFLLPQVTGAYNFWISADDQGAVFLSTDETIGNLVQIAQEPVWNGSRDYFGTARRNAGAPENASLTLFPDGIPLTGGEAYFTQALMKEGGGGDNLSVAWQPPGGSNPTSPIGGAFIGVAADPEGASINITRQPTDVVVESGGGGGRSFVAQFAGGVPSGSAVYGNAYVDGGVLHVTDAANSQQGSFIVDDLNSGDPVSEFSVNYKVRIGGGTARPADGMSFGFGTLPNAGFGEEGEGQLRVTFDHWDNNGDDTAPSIEIRYNGAAVAVTSLAGQREGGRAPNPDNIPTDPATGAGLALATGADFVPVSIVLHADGSMDVSYKGVMVHQGVMTGYTPIAGRFGFGARTGGANDNHWIDDLVITLPGASAPSSQVLLSEDFDSGDGGWTVVNNGPLAAAGGAWGYGADAGVPGNGGAWFVNGTDNAGTPTSSMLVSPPVAVTDSGVVTLSFDHRYSFEYDGTTRWDGGGLMISVNGSPFGPVPAASFALNGYVGTITGNNALNGQGGFNSDSAGYGTPAYIRSSALGQFEQGDTIQIGFLGAWDEFSRGTVPNWVVDNVTIALGDVDVEFATFTVAATGAIVSNPNQSVFIQWQRSDDGGASFQPIAGANNPSYTETVGFEDNGSLFRAQLYVPGIVAASDAARLTIAINNPPSFSCGADVTVMDAGPVTVPGWASNISAGPADYEFNQVVSFSVSTDNPGLFASGPSIDALGNLTFVPAAEGSAVITVVAQDNGGTSFGGQDTSAPCSATINVPTLDACPVAVDQAVEVRENRSVNIALMGSDPEGQPVTFAISSAPANGTLSGTPPAVVYTPTPDFFGSDSFKFTVSDGNCTVEGTVSITVLESLNECPHAVITVVPPTQAVTTRTFVAALNGLNERPDPVSTPGSGTANFSLTGNKLSVDIPYLGLKAPLSAAHIHGPATADESAGVLISLVPPISALATRAGRIVGTVDVTDEQIALILSGKTYVNLHTSAHPGGEIRGQLVRHVEADYQVIAPNNTTATVIFDGSTSWDPDGDPLTYAWFEAPAPNGSITPTPPGKKSSKKSSRKRYDGNNGQTNGDDCEFGRVSELTLEYTGDGQAAVGVAQKGKAVLFFGILQPGDQFSFQGYRGDMSPQIAVFVNGSVNASFDTSGNSPLGRGTFSGDFLVTDGRTIRNGDICDLAPPPVDGRVPFGTDVVASRNLFLGLHVIQLEVSDGDPACASVPATALVEVITPGRAVDGCVELVENSSVARKDKRALAEALKSATKEFDKGKIGKGIDKLEAFIKKVQKEKDISSANKNAFIACARGIIDAL